MLILNRFAALGAIAFRCPEPTWRADSRRRRAGRPLVERGSSVGFGLLCCHLKTRDVLEALLALRVPKKLSIASAWKDGDSDHGRCDRLGTVFQAAQFCNPPARNRLYERIPRREGVHISSGRSQSKRFGPPRFRLNGRPPHLSFRYRSSAH